VCTAKEAEADRLFRAQRRAAGLCRDCGELAVLGRAHCLTCRDYHRGLQQAKRLRRQAAGLCVQCGAASLLPALVDKPNALCEPCYYCFIACFIARKRLGSTKHTAILREKFLAQGGRCAYSGDALTLGLNATLDHILPVSRYPDLRCDPTNVEWVADWVNLMKWDATPDEFRARLRQILGHRWP
jgi:hypothetical protein